MIICAIEAQYPSKYMYRRITTCIPNLDVVWPRCVSLHTWVTPDDLGAQGVEKQLHVQSGAYILVM